MVGNMEVFQVSDLFAAGIQFLKDRLQGDILLGHHDHQVVNEIADLPYCLCLVFIFGRNDGLRTLLTNFL